MHPREDPGLGLPGAQRPTPAGGLLQAVPRPRERRGVSGWFPGCATPSLFCQPRDLEWASPSTPRLCPRLFSALLSPGLSLLEEIPCWDPSPDLSKRFEHLWVRDRSKKHRCLRKRGADRTGLGQRLRPRHSEWGVCAACERELAGGVNRVLEQSPPGAPRAGGQTRGE